MTAVRFGMAFSFGGLRLGTVAGPWSLSCWMVWALGRGAASTCGGLTVVSFVWEDKSTVNKVWNAGSQGRFSFGISFGLGSL